MKISKTNAHRANDRATIDMFSSNSELLEDLGLSEVELQLASLEGSVADLELSNDDISVIMEGLIEVSVGTLKDREQGADASEAWLYEAAWMFGNVPSPLSLANVCQGLGFDMDNVRATALAFINEDFQEEALNADSSSIYEDVVKQELEDTGVTTQLPLVKVEPKKEVQKVEFDESFYDNFMSNESSDFEGIL